MESVPSQAVSSRAGETPTAHGLGTGGEATAEPVIVTFIGTSGYAVIHWIERENCFSIECNRRWGAHDFSLVGRDVKRGESVRCRAWMAYRKLDRKSLDDVLKWKAAAWEKGKGQD